LGREGYIGFIGSLRLLARFAYWLVGSLRFIGSLRLLAFGSLDLLTAVLTVLTMEALGSISRPFTFSQSIIHSQSNHNCFFCNARNSLKSLPLSALACLL